MELKWYIADMFLYAIGIFSGVFLFYVNTQTKRKWKRNLAIYAVGMMIYSVLLGFGAYYWNKDICFLTSWFGNIIISGTVIYCCYETDIKRLLYYCNSGFLLYYIIALMTKTGHSLVPVSKTAAFFFSWYTLRFYIFSILIMILVYVLAYFLFAIKIRKNKELEISPKILVLWVLFSVLTMILSYSEYYVESGNVRARFLLNLAQILYCIFVFAIQLMLYEQNQKRIYQISIQHENQILHELWKMEQREYQVQKENMDIINRKCHDLRHQIRAFRQGGQISQEELEEMEHSIRIYDCKADTGNKALDIILTDRKLRCIDKEIQFSCIADGKLLSSMSESDVYSLFGNALENAIEYLEKNTQPENRYIYLKIWRKDNFVLIEIDNYYADHYDVDQYEKELQDTGTTKPDKEEHGYGIKSMGMIAEKYNGSLKIWKEPGMFHVMIILPIITS